MGKVRLNWRTRVGLLILELTMLWSFTPAYAAPAGYRLPFTGATTITDGPGEGTHTKNSLEAIDLALDCETKVYATQFGSVIFSGWDNSSKDSSGNVCSPDTPCGFGYLIKIQHDDGNISYYGHLKKEGLAPIKTEVLQGQLIGLSNNTGNSLGITGCHLHFEVRKSGTAAVCIRDLAGVWWNTSYNPPSYGAETSGCAQYPAGTSPPSGYYCRSGARPLSCAGGGATDKFLTYISPDSTNVYWIQNGNKYHVVSDVILNTMHDDGMSGWNWPNINDSVPDSYHSAPEFIKSGSVSDGLLILQSGETAVYLIENGKRRWIKSEEARDWMGTAWADDVITVSPRMILNYAPTTGNDIYEIGEGETDPTIKNTFKTSYTTNTNDSNCSSSAKLSSWKGWPGTFSACLEFPIGPTGAATVSGASGIAGRYQKFGNDSSEIGTINYSSKGTYAVHGAIYTKYKELGYSGSTLGFPTSDEKPWGSYRRSDFEGGYIYWNPSNNQTTVATFGNGICGSSNNATFNSAPTTNLCSAGSPTSVTGSGPWSWSCTGSNGGSTANCSAYLQSTSVIEMSLSRQSFDDFGTVTVGQSSEKAILIQSSSNMSTNLAGSVGVAGAGFSIVQGNGSFNLVPGASTTVMVRFAPTSSGAFSGTFTITHNATTTTSPINMPLSGSGQTEACDTTPDSFAFTDQISVPLNTHSTSNQITVSGMTCAASISIIGGTYSINGGAYTNATGTVSPGDSVKVLQTSSGNYSTKTDAVMTISSVTDTFSVTTLTEAISSGDINGNGKIDLTDAIIALKFLSGLNPSEIRTGYRSSGFDVNNDAKIGLAEAVYVLQLVAGLRSPSVVIYSNAALSGNWIAGLGTSGAIYFSADGNGTITDMSGINLVSPPGAYQVSSDGAFSLSVKDTYDGVFSATGTLTSSTSGTIAFVTPSGMLSGTLSKVSDLALCQGNYSGTLTKSGMTYTISFSVSSSGVISNFISNIPGGTSASGRAFAVGNNAVMMIRTNVTSPKAYDQILAWGTMGSGQFTGSFSNNSGPTTGTISLTRSNSGGGGDTGGSNQYFPAVAGYSGIYDVTSSTSAPSTLVTTVISSNSSGFSVKSQTIGSTTYRQTDFVFDGTALKNANGYTFSADGTQIGKAEFTPAGLILPSGMASNTIESTVSAVKYISSTGATNMTSVLTRSITANGEESITTPAGTFTAVKITLALTETFSTGAETVETTTYWYVKNIGRVKYVTTSTSGGVTTTTTTVWRSYLPISLNGQWLFTIIYTYDCESLGTKAGNITITQQDASGFTFPTTLNSNSGTLPANGVGTISGNNVTFNVEPSGSGYPQDTGPVYTGTVSSSFAYMSGTFRNGTGNTWCSFGGNWTASKL